MDEVSTKCEYPFFLIWLCTSLLAGTPRRRHVWWSLIAFFFSSLKLVCSRSGINMFWTLLRVIFWIFCICLSWNLDSFLHIPPVTSRWQTSKCKFGANAVPEARFHSPTSRVDSQSLSDCAVRGSCGFLGQATVPFVLNTPYRFHRTNVACPSLSGP